jgi:hypothetical protein
VGSIHSPGTDGWNWFDEIDACRVMGAVRQELATKADVALLLSDLNTGVATLEAKTANLKADLLLWFIGAQIGAVAVILVVVRMMTRH